MSWHTFLNVEANKQLPYLLQMLLNSECVLHFSPIPDNATVTVTLLPPWEERAMQEDSYSGAREVAKFRGVKMFKATTQDTITMGECESIEIVSAEGDAWRFVLKDVNGDHNRVEFNFSECDIDLV